MMEDLIISKFIKTHRFKYFEPFRHASFHYLSTWWRRCVLCVMIELGMPSLEGKFFVLHTPPPPILKNIVAINMCESLY